MREDFKKRIDSIITNIDQLPSIPEVASKVINMVNDPNVSFKLIAEEISKDQSMTTNILKLCNSAYFSKGKEIVSIDRAIVTLGLKEVKDIVMVIAAKPVLDKAIIGYDLGKGDLWQQGLLVATLSKKIALLKNRKDIADAVFTGGLIHNVGKLVLALFIQGSLAEILNTVEEKQIPFNLAEREVLGYSHNEIGEKILDKWKFPEVLKAVVRYYDEPENVPPKYAFEVSVVHVASALSIMAGVGIGSDGLYHALNEKAVKTAGLTDEAITELFAKIPESLKTVKDLL
jgi:HD-like signal output (HDOD) protein